MFRTASARFAALLTASLLVAPAALQAQKALVYCPVGIDASGCNAIVTALNASPTPFPDGVDGGYDGTQGTTDLATADLSAYAVFVVPSLADGPDVQPYAMLHDATIAARLQAAFMGRVAVWSGTPDVGSTNRSAKDGLIRNLASWARPDASGTHGPGVVAFQDNSDDAVARYGWLGTISSTSISPDTTFDVYSNVQVLTATGQQLLTNTSGLQIGYTNMASYGLFGGTGATADATGGHSGRVVLLTTPGDAADASIATVLTDREDYFPPDTVVVTGSGWEPGETVSLLFQQDVNFNANVTLTTVADDAGHIYNQQFVIDSAHIGVRFTLTATGATSGRTAQATFTDATGLNSVTMLGAQTPATIVPGASATYGTLASNSVQVRFNGNGSCTVSMSASGLPTGAGATFTPATLTGTSTGNMFTLLSVTTNAGTTPTGTATFTVRATGTGGAGNDCSTSTTQTATATLVVQRPSTSTVSGPASSVFGQSVTFTVNVTGAVGTPTGTVQFKDGAANLGAAQTLSGGSASVSTSALSVASHSITAVYNGDANFTGSTSAAFSHAVSQASTTTAVTSSANPSVFGQAITFTATVTTQAPGSGTPAGTVQFKVDGVNSGGAVTLNGSGAATSGSISNLTVGSHTVVAVYNGNTNFSGSTSSTLNQGISQASTTTTVSSPSNPSTFGQSFTFNATVAVTAPGSGTPTGTIQFRVDGTDLGSPVPVSGLSATSPTASGLAVGPHTLAAVYGGDVSFSTSTSANFTHTVGLGSQTITFNLATLPAKTFGDPPFSVASFASASSGLTVTFSSTTPTKCTSDAAGNVTILTAQGNCVIRASQAGNTDYSAAPDVDQTFNVAKAAQTISFTSTAPVGAFVGGPVYTAAATATSGLTVTFGTSTPLVCSSSGTNGSTITMVGGGTCNVTANQTGNGDYLAATQVTQSFAVTAQQAQTISFTSTAPSDAKVGGATYTAAATATSGLTVSFSSLTPLVCTSSGATFSFIAVGNCTVAANQNGNAQYFAATQQTQSFAVGKGTPVVTWANPTDITYGTLLSGTQLNATASVPGTFTYTPAAGTKLGAGNGQTLSVDFVPTDAANYNSVLGTTVSINVLRRSLEVTADAGKTKVYGNGDPTFTYTITGGSLLSGDGFSGALSRAPGENVGTYAITLGTLTAGSNYDVSLVSANFTITARPIEVTADPGQTKVYGNGDPTFTYTVTSGSLAFSDALSGALSRVAGENVGSYAITQGTLALSTNYDLTFVGANFSITKRPIEVTADPGQTKVYGNPNPATYTYSITSGSLAFSDAFSGVLTRAAGENVGSYAITQGTLVLSTNYDLTFVSANFTITRRPIEVTADAGKTKVYGNGDPTFTYTITSGSLVSGDGFSGALSRAPGEDVGTYAITLGTLTAGPNYEVSLVSADFTITVRPIQVTADPGQTKVYGNGDPTFTYTVTNGSLAFSDAFSGALSRVVGENVGSYAITQGTLALSTNYILTYVGANFSITQRPVTVTADPGQTKVYGNSEPAAYTYSITSGSLAFSDAFSGVLTRAAGENVGSYAITQGTLALSTNYELAYVGANFTITKRPIQVTADPGQTKVYGNPNPGTYTYSITSGSLAFSDAFSGALSRIAGENVGNYAITQGTLALSTNYQLTFVSVNFTITQRPIEVTAQAKSKIFGNPDPALTYSITSGNLVFSDAFSGSLTRVSGEAVGTYAILQGTLTAGTNYNLTFVGATFTINAWTLTGFYQPVDMPAGGMVLNSIKGGQTVPLKFEVFAGSVEQTTVGAVKSFTQVQYSCPSTPVLDDIEITSTGGTVLRYDGTAGQFIQNWQTPKTAGLCYRVTMTTQDNSSLVAYFKTK